MAPNFPDGHSVLFYSQRRQFTNTQSDPNSGSNHNANNTATASASACSGTWISTLVRYRSGGFSLRIASAV